MQPSISPSSCHGIKARQHSPEHLVVGSVILMINTDPCFTPNWTGTAHPVVLETTMFPDCQHKVCNIAFHVLILLHIAIQSTFW